MFKVNHLIPIHYEKHISSPIPNGAARLGQPKRRAGATYPHRRRRADERRHHIKVSIRGGAGGGAPTDIIIPETIRGVKVTAIGTGAFQDIKLTSVTIPNSVASIGDLAFAENKLTSVTLPNSVTSIGEGAFNFNRLTSVTIPNSVTSIGEAAFDFNRLSRVTLENNSRLKAIETEAFSNNNLMSITLPTTYAYANAGKWRDYNRKIYDPGATFNQFDIRYTLQSNDSQPLILSQAITFEALAAKTFGDAAFQLTVTSNSGLPVAYSIPNDNGVATIMGTTVTIVGAGTVTITASQAGNDNYEAATPVDQDLTVNKASQAIAFAELTAKTFGDAPFELTATSDSRLSITYASSDNSVATIMGTTVTIVGAGTVTITASQAGNDNYKAATPVGQELKVNKAPLSVAKEEAVAIYPNPVKQILRLDIPKQIGASVYEIQILDINGKRLKSSAHRRGSRLQLEVRDLPAGVHFIVLKSLKDEMKYRFIKQ